MMDITTTSVHGLDQARDQARRICAKPGHSKAITHHSGQNDTDYTCVQRRNPRQHNLESMAPMTFDDEHFRWIRGRNHTSARIEARYGEHRHVCRTIAANPLSADAAHGTQLLWWMCEFSGK